MDTKMDLAEYLQVEYKKLRSLRKLAEEIGISKGAVDQILKRRLKTMPEVETLEKIAARYDLTLPVVVAMAGATMGDGARYQQLARELEAHPWIVERFDELTNMSREEFQETMDYFAYRREKKKKNPPPPPPQDDGQSTL